MSANNRIRVMFPLAAVAMAILGLGTTSADAGIISYVKITGDADCGISADNTYTHKLDFGTGTPGAFINGVQFDAYNSAANGTLNFYRQVSSGLLSDHAGNGNHNVSGHLVDLLTDMYYNGNNAVGGTTTWTLSGLTGGQTYQTRIYTRQWGPDENRQVTFVFDPDGAGPVADSTGKISQDNATSVGFPNGNDAYYINYQFTAVAGEDLVITATQDNYNYSWHLYGLSNQEFSPAMAFVPFPADKATDVLFDADPSWSAGIYAVKHNVYFGTSFDAVNTGSSEVLVGDGLTVNSFDPGRLEYGQTYFWRVDEVNAAPDNTIFTGDVWSFTVEPFAYPITTAITATASSAQPGMGAQNAVNGSGLNDRDEHSTEPTQMWMTTGAKPAWIQFELDKVYKLDNMVVWNSNQGIEGFLGFGAKDVTIEYSTDGVAWTILERVPEFAQATGLPTYTANTTVDFGGVTAKYVKLTIDANWGGVAPQTGLAEVRFFYVPVQAFEPQPADGTTGVSVATSLDWRPGREATSHVVYVGPDSAAVADGSVAGETVADHGYTPAGLTLETEYFWKVDEVGDTGTYAGDVWSFTTEEFTIVDDFESYNDDGSRIYETWIDGLTDGKSGSQVGYDVAPFAEKTIVHGGRQSMPLKYDNASFTFSEANRTFNPVQDWTARGIKSLSLYFRGATGNSGQLYVKINNTKVVYDGAAGDITDTLWLPWNIDLSAVGGNLSNVTSLTLGVEGTGAAGAVYVDDIRLYPRVGELMIPVAPGNANLVGAWGFDEGAGTAVSDSSGNGNTGAAMGGPTWVAGQVGKGALKFDGVDDFVEVPDDPSLDIKDVITISTWANLADISVNAFFVAKNPSGTAPDNYPGNYEFRTEAATGRLQLGHQTAEGTQYVFYTSDGAVVVGEWQHLAVSLAQGDAVKFYINGIPAGTAAQTQPFGILNDNAVRMGTRKDKYRFLKGMMDDVRIYEQALSAAEIAALAGRTAPMHKPF
jgi:hypothetical protein